jgi:hypothetical protein
VLEENKGISRKRVINKDLYILRNDNNSEGRKKKKSLFLNIKNVSSRDIQIYQKRERLERVYQETCGKFLDEIKAEKLRKWNQFDIKKRGGIKTLAQVMSERKFEELPKGYSSKVYKINYDKTPIRKSTRTQSERLKKGFHSIIQNPRKYFKDVIGEKKSIFARELIDVKHILKLNQESLKKKKQKFSMFEQSLPKKKSVFYSYRKSRKK